MQTECQIIIFHFLLIIYHKSPEIAKRCLIPYLLQIFAPQFIFLLSWSTFIGVDDLHK